MNVPRNFARFCQSLISPPPKDVGSCGGFSRITKVFCGSVLATIVILVFSSYLVELKLDTSSNFLGDILEFLDDPDNILPFLVALFVIFPAIASTQRERRPHGLIVLVTCTAAIIVFRCVPEYYLALDPIDKTVGRAGFMGKSSAANQIATVISLGAAAFTGLGAYWLSRLFKRGRADNLIDAPPSEAIEAKDETGKPFRTRHRVILIAVLALTVVAFSPNIGFQLYHAEHRSFVRTWDFTLLLTFTWLVSEGYVPLRDFFFPYSNNSLFFQQLPESVLWRFAYIATIHFGVFRTLFVLTGRRFFWSFFALLAISLGGGLQEMTSDMVFPLPSRYLSGLLVALSYIAINQRSRAFQAAHVWFGFFFFVALFFEPSQVVYAVPGVACVLLFDVIQDRRRVSWRAFSGRLVRDFGLPSILLAGYCTFLVLSGRWAGYQDFYLGLGDVVHYGSVPMDIAESMLHPLSIGFLLLLGPMALVSLGVYERLARKGYDNSHAEFLLVTGLFGFMVLQKYVSRPFGSYTLVLMALGIYGYAALWKGRRGTMELIVLGVAATVFAWMLPPESTRLVGKALRGPSRIAECVQLLGTEGDAIRRANRARYADERFEASFSPELDAVKWLRSRSADGLNPKVYVLDDTSVVYVLLRQQPPYHVNNYNASPIYEQRKVVQWLREEKPDYVVWNPLARGGEFDGIQNFLRVPLIYGEVISSYVPHHTVGDFEVLRPREPGEAVPIKYWRQKLGATADLGHFARSSSFSDFVPCAQTSSGCVDFLRVDISDPDLLGTKISVPVKAGGSTMGIDLDTVPGVTSYYARLDRIWFWGALQESGYSPALATQSPEASSQTEYCVNASMVWDGTRLPGWTVSGCNAYPSNLRKSGVRFDSPLDGKICVARQGFDAALSGQRVRVRVRALAFEPNTLKLRVYSRTALVERTHSGSGNLEDLVVVINVPVDLSMNSPAGVDTAGFEITFGPGGSEEASIDEVSVELMPAGFEASIVSRADRPEILY